MRNKIERMPLILLGFLGEQICVVMFGFAVPDFFNAYSKVFDIESPIWLSISAIGILVQPLAGMASDHAWSVKTGRKNYTIMVGILGAIAMFLMAMSNAWGLIFFFFYIAIVALNILLVIYKAIVVDITDSPKSRIRGFIILGTYHMTAILIVLLLRAWAEADLSMRVTDNNLPASIVILTFLGAVALIVTTLIGSSKTVEPSNADIENSKAIKPFEMTPERELIKADKISYQRQGFMWLSTSVLMALVMGVSGFKNEAFMIPFLMLLFGVMLIISHYIKDGKKSYLKELTVDIMNMPKEMKKISIIQLIAWLGLFLIFTFLTPILEKYIHGSIFGSSDDFAELYLVYVAISAVGLLSIPFINTIINVKNMGTILGSALLLASVGLWSFFMMPSLVTLIIFIVVLGFMWSVMLIVPYIILSFSLPSRRVGVFFGIFNIFTFTPYLIIPQLGKFILESSQGGLMRIVIMGSILLITAGTIAMATRGKLKFFRVD